MEPDEEAAAIEQMQALLSDDFNGRIKSKKIVIKKKDGDIFISVKRFDGLSGKPLQPARIELDIKTINRMKSKLAAIQMDINKKQEVLNNILKAV